MVLGQLPPRKTAPRTIATEDNYPPENCPLTIKFPPKIMTSTQANSPEDYALSTSTIIKSLFKQKLFFKAAS